MQWDMEIDMLAVGAGACGLAAAIAAHDDGLEVAVTEKFATKSPGERNHVRSRRRLMAFANRYAPGVA